MHRWLVSFGLLMLVALAGAGLGNAQVQSLLINGGFESGPPGTGAPPGWNVANADAEVVTTPVHAGQQALQLAPSSLSAGLLSQFVTPPGPGSYTLTAYILKNDVRIEKVSAELSWFDAAGGIGNSLRTSLQLDHVGYQLVSVGPLEVPAGALNLRVLVEVTPLQLGGRVFLDSFSLDVAIATPTATASLTPTSTASVTPTTPSSPTSTPTRTPTVTRTPTATRTATSTPEPEPTSLPLQFRGPLPLAGLLLNPGFEVADDGVPVAWRKQGGSFQQVRGPVRGGSAAGALYSGTNSTKWVYQVVRVQPGRTYTFSGYIYKDDRNVTAAYLRVSWYPSTDGSGRLIESEDSEHLTADAREFVALSTGPITAPPGAQSARVRIVLDPLSSALGVIYFDDMLFTESLPAPIFSEERSTLPVAGTPTPTPTLPSGRGLTPAVTLTTQIPRSNLSFATTETGGVTRLSVTFLPMPVYWAVDRIEVQQPVAGPSPGVVSVTPAPSPSTAPLGMLNTGQGLHVISTPTAPGRVAAETAVPLGRADIRLLITEVMFNPAQAGVDIAHEWFELYNAGADPVDLAGWTIENDGARDPLPAFRIQPGAYVIVAATVAFRDDFPDYDGPLLLLADGSIGNGLANTGDRLILRDQQGRIVDALSYGNDRSVFDPPAPVTRGGASLERQVVATAAGFLENDSPSPGLPFALRVMAPRGEGPLPVAVTGTQRDEAEEQLAVLPLLTGLLLLPLLFAGAIARRRNSR